MKHNLDMKTILAYLRCGPIDSRYCTEVLKLVSEPLIEKLRQQGYCIEVDAAGRYCLCDRQARLM